MKYRMMVLILCIFFSVPASAKLYFGTDESLRFVIDVELEGPNGEDLQLSRKIIRQSFLLPYVVKDGGFVLTIKGQHNSYYELPVPDKVRAMQLVGILPNPLPEWKLETMDMLLGYSLWITLIVLGVWGGIKTLIKKRESVNT